MGSHIPTENIRYSTASRRIALATCSRSFRNTQRTEDRSWRCRSRFCVGYCTLDATSEAMCSAQPDSTPTQDSDCAGLPGCAGSVFKASPQRALRYANCIVRPPTQLCVYSVTQYSFIAPVCLYIVHPRVIEDSVRILSCNTSPHH